jgi:hypothetical protein
MTPDPRAAVWFESVSIMPISPGAKIPYKGFGWTDLQKAPASPEVRAEWAKEYPCCNWALITGAVSGIVALDWDKEKGRELRKEWNVYGGPASITPRGGFHTLHRHPGHVIQSKARLIGDDTGGLDIRGDGGYIVIPPSTFEGKSYKWEIAPWMIEAPPLPERALALIDKKPAPTVAAPEGVGEADGLPAGVGEGQRNDMAARLAGRYLVHLLPEEVWPILQAWNRKNRPSPLPEEELRATLYNIARRERDKAPVLELVDSSDLARLVVAPKRKLIDPFLPAGSKSIVAAWQGSYKTTLLLNWAVAINNALPVFGRFDTSKGRVLYVDRENNPELTNLRVEKIARGMHGARGGITFQFPKEKPDLADRRVRETYIKTIKEGKFDLVIFDSFLCFFNLRNENDNTEVRNVLELVGEIPARTGAAILFIDHAGKASPEKAKSGIKVTPRGASAKGDWADVVMTLEEKDDEARKLRVLRFSKTRYNLPMPPMLLEVGTNLVFVPSGDDEICPVFTVRMKVDDTPGIGATDLYAALMKATGCGKRTAINSTGRAVELGFIRRVERGKFVDYHPAGIGATGDCTNDGKQENGGQKTLVYQ